jgi:hypothetical protein
MLAYKNDEKLKEDFVNEIKWHEKQDKFIKGTYSEGTGDNFKGCAVGCSIKSLNKLNGTRLQTTNHKAYEKYLGLPEWLARLEDTIFEGLPTQDAKKWTLKFSKAIPVGADLKPVKYQFAIYLMKENIARVKKLEIDTDLKKQVLSAIKGSMKVNQTALDTGVWAESAARSAAYSAESAAWSAARSAAYSAESAAWSAAYQKHANRLLTLLKAAK